MDLTLTEDQELIQSTARDLLGSRATIATVRGLVADPAGHSLELWQEMVDLGWMGLALPEAYGGVGSTFMELCLVIEEMGRVALPGPFVPTVVTGALPVARFGTEDQRKAWLTPVVVDGRIMTYARAAPGAGWRGTDSAVVARPAGDGWILDGEARFVPYPHVASQIVVVARRDAAGPGQLTVFVVDGGSDGITTEALETLGADHLRHVRLNGVAVAGGDVLGPVDGGAAVVEATEAYGAAATCARLVGGAERVLEMTVAYAAEREQFGRPIGSFQAVQHHCADMAIDVLGARFIAYEAIWRLARDLDAATEVSMAKAWVSEASRRVCALGHQVHGAIGFTAEHDLGVYLRQAMACELSFGDADFHYEQVARRIGLAPA